MLDAEEWAGVIESGELIDLVWREEGKVISREFGITDPGDPRALIVNYIPVDR